MKKGFTLIELLAVIVILAIIALIAFPTISGIVEKAKKGGAESSILGYLDAVEKQVIINELNSDESDDINDGVYEISTLDVKKVSVKGQKPSEGWIQIEKKQVVNYSLKVNNYYVNPSMENISKPVADKNGSIAAKPGNDTLTGLYVYSTYDEDTRPDGTITQASEGSSTRPSEIMAYFRYTLSNGEILNGTKPEVCTYSVKYGELCLKHNEAEISKNKILEYFGFNENTWIQVDSNVFVNRQPSNGDDYNYVECRVNDGYSNGILTECINMETRDNMASVWTLNNGATPDSNGSQRIKTGGQDYQCYINDSQTICDLY